MKSTVKLGMPHLTYNGLDPVWLAKQLGDNHWNMLSKGPALNSANERLYASFFCWSIDFNQGQHCYCEGDQLDINSQLFKFNNQVYRSVHTLSNGENFSTGTFDSIFVKKDMANQKLVRDDPSYNVNDIGKIDTVFLEEHKKIKLQLRSETEFNSYRNLQFNPESMFNAVKILYCANYLNLVFQSEWLHYAEIKQPIKSIKTYYFANIEPGDPVSGLTVIDGTTSTTKLISGNKVLSLCIITR